MNLKTIQAELANFLPNADLAAHSEKRHGKRVICVRNVLTDAEVAVVYVKARRVVVAGHGTKPATSPRLVAFAVAQSLRS